MSLVTKTTPERLHRLELPELVDLTLAEVPGAFEELVRRFERTAHATAFALLRDSSLARDAVQEAFLDAYKSLPKLRDRAAFPGFFRRIVFKHADRFSRKPTPQLAVPDSLDSVADPRPSPESNFLADERAQLVRTALSALPDHERIVASLFYLGDQSHAQICDYLVLPISTIKKRLHDARKHLRGGLEILESHSRSLPVSQSLSLSFSNLPARLTKHPNPAKRKDLKVNIHSMTPLLNVRNVSRSMEFYCETLGFRCQDNWSHEGRIRWAQLSNGAVEMMLNEAGDADEHTEIHESRPARGNFSDFVLYLRVDDADLLYNHFTEGGFTTSEIFDAEYGLREFHMRDFDGYELSITSRLGA